MNAKTVRINAILTSAMLFLYAGCGVLNLLLGFLINNTTISLPANVLLCLALILPTVVLLIFGIKQAKKKQGVFDLVASVATLLIGIAWAVFAVLSWLLTTARMFIIEYYYRLDIAMSLDKLLALFNYINVAYTLLTTIVALYLLGIYLISVLRAKKKWLQIKAELHKPAVAALILVPNLLSLLQTILNPVFSRMGTDMLIRGARIFMYASFGINTVLTLALAVFVLVFGLIIKKQAKEQPVQPAPQAEQSPSSFDDIPLPAGVNPDDL